LKSKGPRTDDWHANRRPAHCRRLKANGVERLFCVPGESYLAVLDALVDSGVGVTVCRQEGGAAMMADAWGRLTGKPGVCFVTRGPGATNATAGLHIARQDSIPMMLFIGQVQRDAREREAFQEVEYRRAFTEFAKWVAEIDDPARIPEFVNRAFSVAMSGRPGPVVLALPEDVLREMVENPPAEILAEPGTGTHPGAAEIKDLAERLARAERPVMILGGTRWTETAVRQVERFAERAQIPVGCSFRRQMLFDHHPSLLCRRCRHRHQPGACRRRSSNSDLVHAGRRAVFRNAVLRLHADRHPPSRASRWCMSTPTAASLAASTARRWRSTPIRPPSPKRCRKLTSTPMPCRAERGGADA
jgi:thiamine pyrophosphate-dependent acetolactate synthase large subunit-like protein